MKVNFFSGALACQLNIVARGVKKETGKNIK